MRNDCPWTSISAHLNHLLGHCWRHIHATLIALLCHGHIASCQVCCCLGTCLCTRPAHRTVACKHKSGVGLGSSLAEVEAHLCHMLLLMLVACMNSQLGARGTSLAVVPTSRRTQTGHLCRDSSSSPLMGSLPPSNTTMGSKPFVRSSCMRDMKYTTNLYNTNRLRSAGHHKHKAGQAKPGWLLHGG
jgi:hypothetical protein